MDNIERLEKRMVELNNDLQNKRTNPNFGFENIESVDMLIKIIINLDRTDENVKDGIYIYMDDKGNIVNAEYFVKVDEEVTIISFDEEQLNIIKQLYGDVFAVNVE